MEEEHKNKTTDTDDVISKNYDEIESEKEQKFINLMIEIIVSITLKQIYEEGD